MATQADPKELDLRKQLADIDQALAQAARHRAEIEMSRAQRDKMQADIDMARAQRDKMQAEVKILPAATIFQAMIATAALLGAGAAIAKLFFP